MILLGTQLDGLALLIFSSNEDPEPDFPDTCYQFKLALPRSLISYQDTRSPVNTEPGEAIC